MDGALSSLSIRKLSPNIQYHKVEKIIQEGHPPSILSGSIEEPCRSVQTAAECCEAYISYRRRSRVLLPTRQAVLSDRLQQSGGSFGAGQSAERGQVFTVRRTNVYIENWNDDMAQPSGFCRKLRSSSLGHSGIDDADHLRFASVEPSIFGQ